MDTSLIINATNSGKKVTKAITNINPDKDNTILKTFAQKVNALTTNTYVDATRVNKMSVNEEGGNLTFNVDTTHLGTTDLESYVQYETIEGGVRLYFYNAKANDVYIDVTAS